MPPPPPSRLSPAFTTFFTLFLTLLLGAGVILVLAFVSLGVFWMVLCTVGGVGGLIGIHWLLWGARMSQPDEASEGSGE